MQKQFADVHGTLEERGCIDSVDAVLTHAYEKYTERTPAFLEASDTLWNEVKEKQKEKLMKKHRERYGM